MAGKNEVTLTFAGDADKLEKELKRVSRGTGDLESAFDKVGAAAKRSESSLSSVGRGTDRLNKVVGEGGRQFGDYGKGLGGVGDRFDEVDTRAMGAADGFAGLTDAMRWSQLTAQEQAMVFSDMGSSMYNLVIPSLQGGVKGFKNLVSAMGGMKGMLIGGGILAGAGALLVTLDKMEKSKADKQLHDTFKELERGKVITEEMAGGMVTVWTLLDDSMGTLSDRFSQMIDESGPGVAESFLRQAEAAGVSEEALSAMRQELAHTKDEEASAAEATDAFTEALQRQQDHQRAMLDPMYASITASNELASANQEVATATAALNEAEAAGDPVAIAEARRGLAEAHLGVGEAASSAQFAEEALFTALATGQTTVAQMRANLDEMEAQGYLSAGSAAYLRDRINEIESKHVTVGLSGYESVKWQLDTLYSTLSALPESKQIRLGYSSYGVAELNRFRALGGGYNGAVVPGYAAGGGLSWSSGPRGSDRVPMWLTPGEMVLNKGQQQNLFDAIDSGAIGGSVAAQQAVTNVNVTVHGNIHSDRGLVKVIRDELARGGMRGALR